MVRMSARAIAARVLADVLYDGVHLHSALREHAQAIQSGGDAALIQELCYGTLRFQPRLEFWLGELLPRMLKRRDSDVHTLLLLGLYQLTEMRVPEHAALKETVEACRYLRKHWAVKLVNAVLRAFQRQRAVFESELCKSPEAYYAHPHWLIQRIQSDWPNDWQSILAAGNQRPPLTLRTNQRLITRAALLKEFASSAIVAQPCKFSAEGLVLAWPLKVEALPGFASGKFSVQDEAAQLAAGLLDVHPGMRVLDACAAPGGKTCHLLERYPDAGEISCVEIDRQRAEKIRENLSRLHLSARVIVADAANPDGWWDGRVFERILLDAPCSASGVIRRHPDIKAHRRPQDVSAAMALQARLLAALWPLLARGGRLLYATCSVFRQENADAIRSFLGMRVEAKELELEAQWGVNAFPGRQILTGQGGMDGFYYACMEKT
jgi:16S rRNA (cytosine967-C5)-methyltransferase